MSHLSDSPDRADVSRRGIVCPSLRHWRRGLGLVAVTAAVMAAPGGFVAGQTPGSAEQVRWLEERSMLRQARDAAATVSGRPVQWRHPYGAPRPRDAVRHASVWLLDYPGSVV